MKTKQPFFYYLITFMSLTPFWAQAQNASPPPTDNPVATYYNGPDGYPTWTDEINWANVIDMSSFTQGNNDFEKFEAARDILFAQGGGVLYYPAGTYDFSAMPADGPNGRGLMLKSGVVIRGATPTGDADARDGKLSLPTKFVFKFNTRAGGLVPRDWNLIGMMPTPGKQLKDIKNVGIAWVHLTGATVYFGLQVNWGRTYSTAYTWLSSRAKPSWAIRKPDGTHPIDPFAGGSGIYQGVGTGRLVFGCLLEDAVVMNDAINYGTEYETTIDEILAGRKSFYMYKFGPRIGVYGKCVFVANNAIPKSKKNFKYQQRTCNTIQSGLGGCPKQCSSKPYSTLLFDYGKACGIDVNKELVGLTGFNTRGYFEEGVIVQDNYVYNHGHKGYNIAGKWIVVRNNTNDRNFLREDDDVYGLGPGWDLTLDGFIQSTAGGDGCTSDNLSRAFDMGGQAAWIDNNFYNNLGSSPGNDGEGILCQLHGGTNLYSWAITNNKHIKGEGQTGYIGVAAYTRGALMAWNNTAGNVGAAGPDVAVSQNTVADELIEGYCPYGFPAPPKNVKVSPVPDSNFIRITWQDNSYNEIGFRVDRRIGANGKWAAIAYRPPRLDGTIYNQQEWHDYMAPSNGSLYYKIVALTCTQNEIGTSPVVEVLVTSNTQTNTAQSYFKLSPNPASDILNIDFTVNQTQDLTLNIYDVLGNQVLNIGRWQAQAHEPYSFSSSIAQLKEGLYFARLEGQKFSETKRIIVLK